MSRFYVIENTPGYLPEDAQEGFEGHKHIEDAELELIEVVDRWREDLDERGATGEVGISEDRTHAWMTDRSDFGPHDLGRVASVVEGSDGGWHA